MTIPATRYVQRARSTERLTTAAARRAQVEADETTLLARVRALERDIAELEAALGPGTATSVSTTKLQQAYASTKSRFDAFVGEVRATATRFEAAHRGVGGDAAARCSRVRFLTVYVNGCETYKTSLEEIRGYMMETSTGSTARRHMPQAARRALEAWVREHVAHPFPTPEDKRSLAEQTGVPVDQISTWFINARARKFRFLSSSASASASASSASGSTASSSSGSGAKHRSATSSKPATSSSTTRTRASKRRRRAQASPSSSSSSDVSMGDHDEGDDDDDNDDDDDSSFSA